MSNRATLLMMPDSCAAGCLHAAARTCAQVPHSPQQKLTMRCVVLRCAALCLLTLEAVAQLISRDVQRLLLKPTEDVLHLKLNTTTTNTQHHRVNTLTACRGQDRMYSASSC
jgi:hypothetical protein